MKNDMAADMLMNSKDAFGATFNYESSDYTPHDDDSIERPTTLGIQLTNPYLIPNMRKAYSNLGLSSSKAVINNLYVRFLPSGVDQLAILDSVMEAKGLDLFDTPMDFQITNEGDFYQDPSIPDSLPTWQYAVVPPNFVFPSGIQYQTLAQIHIPGDNYTAVETEAERLASIQDSITVQMMSVNGGIHPNVLQCDPGYHWDFELKRCVPDNCPDGYHWSDGHCVPDIPPSLDPPPPAPDAAKPSGYIKVHDTNFGSDVPVRKARIVAKRWFKIERTYTDNSGHFTCTKRFKHKVKINVKFKNSDAQVRNVRGIRFWQMFFPVKKKLGVFSGDKSSINYTFVQYPDYSAKGNIYWTAATVHNAVQEYRDYAIQEAIASPPQGLKIFISKSSMAGNGGASPLFGKRYQFNLGTQYVLYNISAVASIVNNIIAIIKGQIDMIIGYRYETNGVRDMSQLLSDRIKETTYHELSHAGKYTALGGGWYQSFVAAEEAMIISNLSSGYAPYGDGTSSYSDIIALGESWAYYMGHYLADKRYTTTSSDQFEQGNIYHNNSPISGFSSHLNLLEDFNPYRTYDPFYWIPQGLFYDMVDARNEQKATGGAVDDNVSSYYTNQKSFNAFSPGITTLSTYKTNLLQQNSNNQLAQVTSLFFQYGY